MNARDNTPLRTLIADRFAAGEDTADGIAKAAPVAVDDTAKALCDAP